MRIRATRNPFPYIYRIFQSFRILCSNNCRRRKRGRPLKIDGLFYEICIGVAPPSGKCQRGRCIKKNGESRGERKRERERANSEWSVERDAENCLS